ncbi:MAG TPA: vWA domain-containing protein [Pyrinomonadaceae bacterium]|nr:vWA domain-containing protein [Pyrinomonadaceae bacterium]
MPILNDTQLDQINLPNSHYGYSATRLEDLGATEYTIATVVADVSGSTTAFTLDMEAAITRIVQACKFSPRADNLLLRLLTFDDSLTEFHGFKLLENCHLADYGGSLRSGGSTALYDATENAVVSTTNYAHKLSAADFSANAILFVITDGMDNASRTSAKMVKAALDDAIKSEALESVVSILIGVNVQLAEVSRYLNQFHRDAGFTQYVELDQADAKTLARLAEFVSRSISAQSQALGTGGASQPLVF